MLIAGLLPSASAWAGEGAEIVGKHTIVFGAPARMVPTSKMVDGPLMGNGDIGVVLAGPPEQLRFCIGKNDFWGIRTQAPMTVGQVQIQMPQLQGASYRAEADMLHAEVRGEFSKEDWKVATRSWVDANDNRLFIEIANRGTQSVTLGIVQVKGGTARPVPPEVDDTNRPVLAGCEQLGQMRWYFNGEMADLKVQAQALAAEQIAELARIKPSQVQAFDGKTRKPLDAPAITKQLTISGWIKANNFSNTEANYILSKGAWNRAYSLGLSGGRVRLAINGTFIQTDEVVAKGQWLHVAGVYDGRSMAIYINGQLKQELGLIAKEAGLEFSYYPDAPNPQGRTVAVATRIVGGKGNQHTLKVGEKAVVASVILTDLDAKAPLAQAKSQVASLDDSKVAEMSARHRAWWKDFWDRSFLEIPDKVIEQHWYSSLYIMGSCSRAGKVAPGLWGNWITSDHTAWHGDYHLNYNFQAPFYGVYAANHPDISLPFYDAMNQMIPRGRKIAAERGWKGIHLPVSMGPWGMCPSGERTDWGQRSNAAYSALLYIWYYQYTQDAQWLKKDGYPYLREVAEFWEDYLKFESGRYVICNDSIHEGSGPNVNGLLSLGLVRTLFKNMLAMSADLGVDADKRAKWQHICTHISGFPTQEKMGKTIFRYSEKGTAWWRNNTLGIQHIFPAGAIGPDSDPKLLDVSRNMIDSMARWNDYNGSSSWYTACARVRYDPHVILKNMRAMYDRHMPNKILYFGGGGIENVSPFLAVTEMLMQSSDGTIRLFSCWPKEMDSKFGTLRAVGAFLVSAELKGGVISGVRIVSEKGKYCTVQNPWPGKAVRVMRDGKTAERSIGERLTFTTRATETIELKPQAE